jgi:hypothetical protein
MRTYSVVEYPKYEEEYFNFLITEYGYNLTENKKVTFGFIATYQKGDVRIHLDYETRDDFFYFTLIRGRDTKYPNDFDNENIKPFFRLFEKYEPKSVIDKLQPDDKQYLESLKLNADLLKKYGDKVLKGEEWI